MEVRSLFSLILKIIGIFFIRDILEAFSRLLSVLVYLPQYASANEGYFNLGVTIPPLILYSLFTYLLIFRTNSLINLLKLDKNFSGQIDLRIDKGVIMKSATVIIGGYMVVSELPEFFRHIVYYVQERKLYTRIVRPDISYAAMSAAKIAIGIALVIFNQPILKFLGRFSKV
jgi:hypothetical protein